MPQLKDAPSLLKLSTIAVGEFVMYTINQWPKMNLCDSAFYATVKQRVFLLRNHVEKFVPLPLYKDVAIAVLGAIAQHLNDKKIDERLKVLIIEVVFGKKLQELDFTVWPSFMWRTLYENLPLARNLRVLNMGSTTGTDITGFEQYLVNALKQMTELCSLTLSTYCTDTIVIAVGRHCSHLHYLDVNDSMHVTDACVNALAGSKLRVINMYNTSLTTFSYKKLLISCRELQEIGRCDFLGDVLESLHRCNEKNYTFNLNKLSCRHLSDAHLNLLTELFPHLTYVTIYCNMMRMEFSLLGRLQKLSALKLLSAHFYSDNLERLLTLLGPHLTRLHLEHVDEMDLMALVAIGQRLPRLRSLVVYNCEFRNEILPEFRPRISVLPYQDLEELFFVVDSCYACLYLLLAYSFNIKSIHLGLSTRMTHQLLMDVFLSNKMKALEVFELMVGNDFSIHSAHFLLNNCPRLRVLKELGSWPGVSSAEIRDLRENIKKNNYDLDTGSFPFYS